MSSLSLQPATSADWEDVLHYETMADSQYYPAYKDKKDIEAYMATSTVFFIVYEGKKVGTVSYQKKEDGSVYFNGLTVLPECQHKGIATQAMHLLIATLPDTELLTAVVHPCNTPSLLICLKLGFTIKEWRENVFGDGEPRLFVTRSSET
ncbi:MAG TPA: GNAT family N-acetyltransferase [bacterium]|nr:GNAT family N-acetyltransferase [bacterium]